MAFCRIVGSLIAGVAILVGAALTWKAIDDDSTIQGDANQVRRVVDRTFVE